jgi:hypothetical protein
MGNRIVDRGRSGKRSRAISNVEYPISNAQVIEKNVLLGNWLLRIEYWIFFNPARG